MQTSPFPMPSGHTHRGDPEFWTPRCSGRLTWYMMEEGGGSMHGCWSGRGSSSSRSTLDRASSRVTWVVMAAVCVFCTEGKGEKIGWRMSGMSGVQGCKGCWRWEQSHPVQPPSKEQRGFIYMLWDHFHLLPLHKVPATRAWYLRISLQFTGYFFISIVWTKPHHNPLWSTWQVVRQPRDWWRNKTQSNYM